MNRRPHRLVAHGFAGLVLLAAAPASGASLERVLQTDWWAGVTGLPSYVNMYLYVPDQAATKPPIVVAPHHCQGSGQSTYNEMSSLVSIANTSGFIMIFPEATGQNCWDAGSSRSLSHGGKGDTGAVVQMVRYALSRYGGDATRVYAVGGSSGGIMTEALLGVYPDVFMAGVSLMGVPCGCWAQGYNDITGTGSTAQWSGPCAGGNVMKSGQAWGDLVRSYFPGYEGHRPRLQHWHGTADTTLHFKNMAEDVKEWTNLLGLSETPTGMDMPASGTTRQFWRNTCGFTVFETFALSGVGHAVPFDGRAVATYFGLDRAGGLDPETAACGNGMGGMGGGTGMGGAGMGGAAATSGASSMSGNGGAAGSSTGGSAGEMPAAGSSSIGGEAGTVGSAGSSASGGGVSGVGGATATGGTLPGSGGSATAGTQSSSGSPGVGGASGTSSTARGDSASSNGCACTIVGVRRGNPFSALLLLAGLGWVLRRSRRDRKR